MSSGNPTVTVMDPATSSPLSGIASPMTAAIVGPFIPQLGRDIILTLSGTWAGSAQLMRSTNGGSTLLPVTLMGSIWANYITNCNEVVWNETSATATLYLQTTLTSGSVTYLLSQ